MTIYVEGTDVGSACCSATSTKRYLHHGYFGYHAYMVDIHEERKISVSNVPQFESFHIYCPEDFPGVPLERH